MQVKVLKIVFYVVTILFTLLFGFLGFIIIRYNTDNIFEQATYLFLWFTFILAFYGIVIKFFKDLKHNKKGIEFHKKYKAVNEIDFFETEINCIPGYKKIIKSDTGLILINESGIFEVRMIYHHGTVKGDLYQEKWQLDHCEIDNPFLLKKKEVMSYLVLTKNLLCELTNVRLVTKNKLVFVLENMSQQHKYSINEIDQMFQIISGENYGNNED